MAGLRVKEPQEQLKNSRFASARGANQRDGFPGLHGEGDVIHCDGLAKSDGQVLDVQDIRHLNVFRGSKASRTPSKTKTSSESMMVMVKKAENASQGACRLFLACKASSPSDG